MNLQKQINYLIEENLINLFNEGFSILTVFEEDEVRKKINEFNFNEDKIKEWIEYQFSH